jgi:hypothetical protein
MADSYEQQYFGEVSPTRPPSIDTDGDGALDYAEFVAGTNPTNSLSYLRFLKPAVQNTGVVRLDWPTVPGRSYRITGSANLTGWTPATDWLRANGSLLSFSTQFTNGTSFYRLEVKP